MKKLMYESIPDDLIDILPINIFYAEAKTNSSKVIDGFIYAESTFYNTNKMNCRPLYKPAFL